jgi:uncharacterized Zn-binding protein involved in type VI secretion
MPAVQRLTDANDGGGIIQTIPQSFVRVDGLVVAVVGSKGSAHPPCPEVNAHCANVWTTTRGAPRVRINGVPVIRTNDPDSCSPHKRVGGSSTTRIGDGGGAPGGPNDWDTAKWDEAEWQ